MHGEDWEMVNMALGISHMKQDMGVSINLGKLCCNLTATEPWKS